MCYPANIILRFALARRDAHTFGDDPPIISALYKYLCASVARHGKYLPADTGVPNTRERVGYIVISKTRRFILVLCKSRGARINRGSKPRKNNSSQVPELNSCSSENKKNFHGRALSRNFKRGTIPWKAIILKFEYRGNLLKHKFIEILRLSRYT